MKTKNKDKHIMKKFKLMAIALVMGTTSLFATSIVNPVGSIEEIREQITELVDAANVNFDENKTVDLIFTFRNPFRKKWVFLSPC